MAIMAYIKEKKMHWENLIATCGGTIETGRCINEWDTLRHQALEDRLPPELEHLKEEFKTFCIERYIYVYSQYRMTPQDHDPFAPPKNKRKKAAKAHEDLPSTTLDQVTRNKLCRMRKLAENGYYTKKHNEYILSSSSQELVQSSLWKKLNSRGKYVRQDK